MWFFLVEGVVFALGGVCGVCRLICGWMLFFGFPRRGSKCFNVFLLGFVVDG